MAQLAAASGSDWDQLAITDEAAFFWASPAGKAATNVAASRGASCAQPPHAEASAVLRNYRSDGSLFWNEVSISPIRNPSNQITHFIGTQTDVTERVNADAIR